MKRKVRLMLIMLLIWCLSVLASGCYWKPRSYKPKIAVDPIEHRQAYEQGQKCGLKFRNDQLRAYRVVIELHSSSDRNKFLRGFKGAYTKASDTGLGEEWGEVLKESVEGGIYEQAFEQGEKHVRGQVSNAQIQTFIRRTIGLARSFELGWKAGYIDGFIQGKSEPGSFYEQAETMYRMCRAATES